MSIQLSCRDLGIQDCDWVATGETAGDIVEQVVRHLRKEQNINLPDPEEILEGDFTQSPLDDTMDPAVATIIRRLREKLNLEERGTSPDIGLVSGRVKSP